MGKETSIGWTHHTFNPWWGCTHDGPECDRCYAETFAKRTGHAVWGHDAPRRFFGDIHWGEPLLWNKEAEALGERRRVFCASMADVGERLPGETGERMDAERRRLVKLIARTPWLDWLLLTKRPQNLPTVFPEYGRFAWPENVWLGTTAGDQAGLEKRGKYLVQLHAPVLFISHEPALGPLDLGPWLHAGRCRAISPAPDRFRCGQRADHEGNHYALAESSAPWFGKVQIDWVITGGESGGKHVVRPYDPAWAESVIAQCLAAGAAPFVKQMGSNPVGLRLKHPKGEDPSEWPPELRVRQFPEVRP